MHSNGRLHLLPTLLRDGGKVNLLDEMENDLLKLKHQQAEELKSIMTREAQFYKIVFLLCLELLVYVLAIA